MLCIIIIDLSVIIIIIIHITNTEETSVAFPNIRPGIVSPQ